MKSILQNFFIGELLIIKVENLLDHVQIDLKSKKEFQECPTCNKTTYSIHSKYKRTANDLTLIGKRLVLTIQVNKFKCKNPNCATKIFCQRIKGFLEKNQQKTERLLKYLENIAFTNTGECGSRICKNNNILVSGDTLIRLVKRWNPLDIKSTKIGVDDWAYKKSHTYGTLIVDLETHSPIDVLKGSDSKTLYDWLEHNPQVEIVSRDRGTSYASAAKGLIQIADRFHIMQNFLDNVKSIVVKNLPNRIFIKKESLIKSTKVDIKQEERTSPNLELRKENTIKAQSLKKVGWKYQQIADEIGVSLSTVKRILELDAKKMYIKPRGAKPALDNYKDIIQKQLNDGCTNYSEIYRSLKLEGYNGCHTSVNNYILKMVSRSKGEIIKKTYISSNDVMQKIWRGKKFSEEELFILRKKWSQFDYFSEKVRKFRGLIKNKKLDKFDKFISEVESDKKNIFYSFVKGLKKDIVAIRNALIYEYSNGVLEGSINKLKTIKRMMYGRAGYELLRKKILYYNS